jgi:hypothetical protein
MGPILFENYGGVHFESRRNFRFSIYPVTVTDNGPGFTNDSIIVNDGIRDYSLSLFDGELIIINTW